MTIEATTLLLRAVAFAAHKHRDQRRKDAGASPYINHPIALASVLADEGGISDINVLCAAVLHDTVEDTDTSEAELISTFGAKIIASVCRRLECVVSSGMDGGMLAARSAALALSASDLGAF